MLLVTIELLLLTAAVGARDLVRLGPIQYQHARQMVGEVKHVTSRRFNENSWIDQSEQDFFGLTIGRDDAWEMSMSLSPSSAPTPSTGVAPILPHPSAGSTSPMFPSTSHSPTLQGSDVPSKSPDSDLQVPSQAPSVILASPIELPITQSPSLQPLPILVPTTTNSSISPTMMKRSPTIGNTPTKTRSDVPDAPNGTTLIPQPSPAPSNSNINGEIIADDTERLSVSPWSLATLSLICASTVVAVAALYRKRTQSNRRHMELVEDESVGSPLQA